MPDFLELVLRGGAATTFLLVSVILLRDGGDRTLARLGVLFCVSTAWWTFNAPQFAAWSHYWALPLMVIGHGKTAAFWLFSRALFEDGFRMRSWDWVVLGGMMALGWVWYVLGSLGLPTQPAQMPHQMAQIALAASAAWVAWKGRGADLIEPRRRVRIAFVLLSSLFMIGITTSYLVPGAPSPLVRDLNVIRMFVMSVGMALLVTGLRSEEMFAPSGEAASSPPGDKGSTLACVDPAEARLLTRLRRLMEEERVYRLEGLTIGALAPRAGAPEYALRRLINGRLGYRNFNAYLNGWRLGGRACGASGPSSARGADLDHRVGRRLQLAGPLQPRVQGGRGRDAQRVQRGRAARCHPLGQIADSEIRLAVFETRRARRTVPAPPVVWIGRTP